jgi:hypothetical protein
MTKGQEEADDEAVGEDEGTAAAHFLHCRRSCDGRAINCNHVLSSVLARSTRTTA